MTPSKILNSNLGDSIILDLTKSVEENYNSIENQTKRNICNTLGKYSAFLNIEKDTFQINFFTDRPCEKNEYDYPDEYLMAHFHIYEILLNEKDQILFDGKLSNLDTLEQSIYTRLLEDNWKKENEPIHFSLNYDLNTKLKSRNRIFSSSINAYLKIIENKYGKPICKLNNSEIDSIKHDLYPIFWFRGVKEPGIYTESIDSIINTYTEELELEVEL